MGIVSSLTCDTPLCMGCDPCIQITDDKTNIETEQDIAGSVLYNHALQPNRDTILSNNASQDTLPSYDPTLSYVTSLDHKTLQLFLNVETSLASASPKLLIPEIKTIIIKSEDTIIGSQKRLSTIENISNPVQLANTIRSNYDTVSKSDSDNAMDPDDNKTESNSNSEPDPTHSEEKQIAHINTTALYRQGTGHQWDEDDIDSLENEMVQQFEVLKRQATPQDIFRLNRSGRLSQVITIPNDIDELMRSESDSLHLGLNHNLFRDESSEHWKKDEIEREKQEMTKEMIHLVTLHQHMNSIDQQMDREYTSSSN